MNTNVEFVWAFNLKVFIQAYMDLGYKSQLDDWNVRFSDGTVLLDNTYTRSTTTFSVVNGILAVEVCPWNLELAASKLQNIDLLQTNFGWRDSVLEPVRDPSPEAVAFLGHLSDLGYYPMRIQGEYEDDFMEEDYHGMSAQNFWGADC